MGRPLAAVQDGDIITISVQKRVIEVSLTDEEIAQRLEVHTPPPARITEGVLVNWRMTATQFHEGAMLRRKL